MFALGWIVAQYAKTDPCGRLACTTTCRTGSARRSARAAGWLYYGGTIILTTGLGVLDRRVRARQPAARPGRSTSTCRSGSGTRSSRSCCSWSCTSVCKISTRVQLTLALISIAVVLIFFITVIADLGSANDVAKAFDPTPRPDGFSGILFGVLYGVLIFVGFETAANLAEETAEPKRSIPRAVLGAVVIVSVFYLIAAYVEVAGFGFDLGGDHEPGGGRRAAVRARRSGEPAGVGVLAEDPAAGRVPRHAGGLRRRGRRFDPRRLRDGAGSAAAAACSPPCRSATGRRWARSCC